MDMELLKGPLMEPSLWLSALAGLLVVSLLQYYKNTYLYWPNRGIKGDRPLWLFSELCNILGDRCKRAIERSRKFGKIHGTFLMGRPRLVVADAEVMRQICIRDFDAFQNHGGLEFANKYQQNFLVFLKGEHWRRVRAMMSPQFTSSRIKRMYRLLEGCAHDLVENFREQLGSASSSSSPPAEGGPEAGRPLVVDLFNTYSLYTMDGITTCCYGLKLARKRGDLDIKRAATRNELVRDCNKVLQMPLSRLLLVGVLPKRVLKMFDYNILNEETMGSLVRRVERLVVTRRADKARKHDDLLQMLIDARLEDEMELTDLDQAENHHASLTHEQLVSDHSKLKSLAVPGDESYGERAQKHRALATKLTDLEILSEALFLLAAGLDTTRASLSTITYLLAHNPEVQERLYETLKKIARHEETPVGKQLKFDYDELTSCAYLDAVVSESLRFFGPAVYTDRVAERDYHIEKYDIRLERGSLLLLGLHALHHNPEYWPEPERFDPERFMPGQRDKIVPGSYAPFSMGPRHCVGMRFSLTETKLGLAHVIMRYKFAPAPGTRYPPVPNVGVSLVRVHNCKALVELRELNY